MEAKVEGNESNMFREPAYTHRKEMYMVKQ